MGAQGIFFTLLPRESVKHGKNRLGGVKPCQCAFKGDARAFIF